MNGIAFPWHMLCDFVSGFNATGFHFTGVQSSSRPCLWRAGLKCKADAPVTSPRRRPSTAGTTA